jgi:hypothetical protein
MLTVFKVDEMARACSTHVERRNAYSVSLGKPGRNRSRRRWEYNIKNSLNEIGWDVMDWILLAQVRTSGGLF